MFSKLTRKFGQGTPKPQPNQPNHVFHFTEREIAEARSHMVREDIRPFEQLDTVPMLEGKSSKDKLESLVGNGWLRDGIHIPTLKPPLPWDEHGRSFSFHLHAFEPLSILISGYETYRDERYLQLALDVQASWIFLFQKPLLSMELHNAIETALSMPNTMAWYDMSVGQRIYRMAYLADVLARQPETPDSEFGNALKSIAFQHEMLARDDFFKSHNNHGFYQALGQMAAARRFRFLPGFEGYFQKASDRLKLMLERSFFPSGPHMEHSPAYHYMVLGSSLGARRSGLIEDPEVNKVLSNAEHALGWMIQPNGSLVSFGDSDPKPRYVPEKSTEHYSDESIRTLMTGGEAGGHAPVGMKSYPEAGYVFARHLKEQSPEGVKTASYFAQIAAFHSRTHKHADHLHFIWSERGQNVLIDPGRYGYAGKTQLGDDLSNQGFFYSDPNRVYVEKTRAHNCVEIDGLDYPRKKAKPFGSALLYAAEHDGLWVTLSEVRHWKVRHFRLTIVSPDNFLLTADWLKDGEQATHDFRQWFQLAPEWTARLENGELKASHNTLPDFHISGASLLSGPTLDRVRIGENTPDMSGWYSDAPHSLRPSPSINWHLSDIPLARFATIFSLTEHLSADRSFSNINDSMTKGQFRWTDSEGDKTLHFTRNTNDNSVSIRFSKDAVKEGQLTDLKTNSHRTCRACKAPLTQDDANTFGEFCQAHGLERAEFEEALMTRHEDLRQM